ATLDLGSKKLLEFGELTLSDDEVGFEGEQIVEVEVETTISDEVPLADRVTRLRFPATVLSVDPRGLIRAPSALKKGTGYSFLHQPVYYQRRPTSQPLEPPLLEPNQQMNESFDPAIRDLALKLTEGKTSTYERALSIENHLQSDYQYSLDSVFNSQNYTPLSEFLFETKSGHCEYFASAMAMMLRSVDIPARLVTGFAVHHYNPLTGLYEVRALHGHAWVEAWLQDVGWVSFQPTPGYLMPLEPDETESSDSTGEELNQYLEQLSRLDQVLAPEDIPALILTRLHEFAKRISQISKRMAGYVSQWIGRNVFSIVLLALIVAALYAGYRYFRHDLIRRWVRLRFGRLNSTDDDTFWQGSYRLLDRWFGSHGYPRQPWMTMEEYVSNLPVDSALRQALEQDYLQGANHFFYRTENTNQMANHESSKARAYSVLQQVFVDRTK
ncbi:MAG: transglutaminase-like domain-containing protein, partial [bacterium]